MTYIKVVEPTEARGTVEKIYNEVLEYTGIVPTFLKVMGHRPDILEDTWSLGNRLMFEPHALSPATKALIASYVSKINSCEY